MNNRLPFLLTLLGFFVVTLTVVLVYRADSADKEFRIHPTEETKGPASTRVGNE